LPELPGALADVRVISLGSFVAGNTFAMTLAELGADVVKLESRTRPDPVRARFTAEQAEVREPSGAETTTLFAGLSRSVRDMSVDMKAPGATELFLRLAGAADVIFENFGPRVLGSWGLTWERLRQVNPGLVLVSLSGYGRTGPRASYLAYGGNISSYTGLTYLWGESHATIYDYVAGTHAVVAALAALEQRDRHGHGTYVDLAQVEVAGAALAALMLDGLNGGEYVEPAGNCVAGAWLSGVFRCAGADEWVAVEVEDAAGWRSLCDIVSHSGARADLPPDSRERDVVKGLVQTWASGLSKWRVAKQLQEYGVAAAPVQHGEDVWRDPQLRSRGSIIEVGHPDLGRFEYPAPVHRMSRTPATVRRPAPRLGQDTRDVLSRWLRVDDEAMSALLATRLVATSDPAESP
jgi:crotonobetainyl-CoA:carnitine CoA-transferase CaiB-like acyl-CoA transferase